MSRHSEPSGRRRLLIVAAALVLCGPAPAQLPDKDKAPAARTKPAPVESMARLVDRSPPVSVFRCWQEGRLIFESAGVSLPTGSGVVFPVTKSAGGGTVQLLDLRQGLCILEKPNG